MLINLEHGDSYSCNNICGMHSSGEHLIPQQNIPLRAKIPMPDAKSTAIAPWKARTIARLLVAHTAAGDPGAAADAAAPPLPPSEVSDGMHRWQRHSNYHSSYTTFLSVCRRFFFSHCFRVS